MSWITDAKALDERIRGLIDAGRFFYEACAVNSEDSYNVSGKYLSPEARRIFDEVKEFRKRYEAVLPAAALKAIDRYIGLAGDVVTNEGVHGLPGLKARLAPLAAFRTELSFYLSDRSEVAHRLSERAFRHLQRSIVAHPGMRQGWIKAFEQGELACEKAGAVQLLLHGLWAFKVSGAGEATDLIFPEPIDVRNAESSAEAIVLTEWKVIEDKQEVAKQADAAHRQAARYARGVLGGLELHAYRYLVLVSRSFVDLPKDFKENDVLYRHINIAVDPQTPSKSD
jgi:hypothetical protein